MRAKEKKLDRVLLVEDDDLTRFMMTEMLDELGVVVDVAVDGQHCIETLRREPNKYDVVLMDIHMPRKTGLEALQEIRKQPEDPPRGLYVVAVTADPKWHDHSTAREAGFDAVLSKPVSVSSIRNMLV